MPLTAAEKKAIQRDREARGVVVVRIGRHPPLEMAQKDADKLYRRLTDERKAP